MLRGRQMLRDLAGHAEARYTSPSGKWEPQKTLEQHTDVVRAVLSKELPDFYVEESRGRNAGEETAGMILTGPLRWTGGIRRKGQV